jgi:aspartate/methionine/tyrosine aminotransferase
VQLKPFLLDKWLDNYGRHIEFDLLSSAGPSWTVNEIVDLAGGDQRQLFLDHDLVYGRPGGSDGLREAIAEMHDVSQDCVQIVTGASEALVLLMWLAAEPGANVKLPRPGFGTFSALPESLGVETCFYRLRKENNFNFDIDEIIKLADGSTKMIILNSPHNPTGAMVDDEEMERLHKFTSERGIQLVSDEVYHPISYGRETSSASRLPHATVIHDFSKAFALPGVRTGWIIDRDPKRQEQYWNGRAYFSISNNSAGEILAEIAMRNRNIVLARTRGIARINLELLDLFMAEHREVLGWIRPRGGMTAFPWLVSGENATAFCRSAVEHGILLAPGDCFDTPSHFRLGFAAIGNEFPQALDRFGEFIKKWQSKSRNGGI